MENSINIKFWGVRGSTPCANPENMEFGGNTTCVQIQIPGENELLVLDCGTGFRNLGNVIHKDNSPVKGRVFVTHPHWDHLQGFPFFKPFYDSKNWFKMYLPPQGVIGCREILQGHMSSTFFPISIDTLEADLNYETYEKGEKVFNHYSVDYMLSNHTVPTAMYKITIGDKVIIFAPDNELTLNDESSEMKAFVRKFREFITDADILIHDAQYTKEQYMNRVGWGHSAWETVVEVAVQQNVQSLYLVHHDPDSTDRHLGHINHMIKSSFKNDFKHISLVKEGQDVNLECQKVFEKVDAE